MRAQVFLVLCWEQGLLGLLDCAAALVVMSQGHQPHQAGFVAPKGTE
jgi:hypothetical protein